MKSSLFVLVLLVCLAAPPALGHAFQGGAGSGSQGGATGSTQGGGGGGGGGGPMTEKTPFELFADKLKLDSKNQLPEVEKIFTGAASGALSTSQEMVTLRARMVELDGKTAELAPVTTAFNAAAARMTRAEVMAFKQVQKLLKPDQAPKSSDAFVLMAGLFNAPTPRAPRTMRRGGGGQ